MASESTDHSDEQATGHSAVEADARSDAAPVKKAARKRATKAASSPRRATKKTTAATEAGADVASEQSGAPDAAVAADEPAARPTRARRPRKAAAPKAAAHPTPEAPTDEASTDEANTGEVSTGEVSTDALGDQSVADESVADEPVADESVADESVAEEAAEREDPTTSAVASFGLLFQAPEPVAPRRRRATSAAGAPSQRRIEDDEAGAETPDASESTGQPETEAPVEPAKDESRAAQEGDADEQDEGAGRRSRRRGGRGRRSRGADTATGEQDGQDGAGEGRGATDTEGPDDAQRPDSQEAGDGEAADGSIEGDSSRRRRRRRRGAADAELDESRGARAREQVTALRGSTRLEAKKQRRREGREAGRRRQIITEAEFLARRESVERTMVVREHGATTQIGVLEDGILVEHYVSRETGASMIGNVYLGRVQNVLPSMEAAFVDVGKGRNAVLYAGEVNWDAAGLEGNMPRRIENALTAGDTVLVQVTKDPIGHKGARLTSQVSLPGRFLVYVPEASMTGISRKLPDTERARLKSILKKIVPDDAGVIVRTAAEGASEEELTADIERLTKAWERIKSKSQLYGKKKSGAPVLLHGEPDLTVKVIRDVFNEDFTSLVVSGDTAYEEISGYLDDVAPELAKRLSKWTGERDIFAEHRVDEQLAKALDRKVWLPSGGSLVIDRTEAMTVVDVNTGKFVGSGGNLEETVTKNNIEAAEEIVRQLRLRDIGGIIVIDFIDMVLESNRDLVVRRLLECLGRDRTKHQVAEVTSLGLVQMTRKRVGSGLLEVFSEPCTQCAGRGLVVHSEPITQPAAEDNGGRGRGRARGSSSSSGRESSERSVASKPASNGPSAAQIAAAAHAAALKAVAAATTDTDAEEEASYPAAEVPGEVPAEGAIVEATLEVPAAGEPSGEPTSAPVTPETAAADTTETAAPETAAPVTPETAAPEPAARTGSESASQADSAPSVRPRRKRGRVVAQAGPPGASEVRVLTPED